MLSKLNSTVKTPKNEVDEDEKLAKETRVVSSFDSRL